MFLCNKVLQDKKLKQNFSVNVYDYGVFTNQTINNTIGYLA